MAYVKTSPDAQQRRNRAKLEVLYNTSDPDALIDPYEIEEDEWIDDVTLWPAVDFGEIYTYLVDTPEEFTRERMKAFKSLDAFNYYIRYCNS